MVSELGFMGRDLTSNTTFIDLVFCFRLFLQSGILFSFLLRSGFLCLLIITIERDNSLQSVSVRLDGNNYSY
jgi:hypothetical protein